MKFDLAKPTLTNSLLDAIFDDHFDFFTPDKSTWAPKSNISERDDKYFIELELPGVPKDDVTLSVKGRYLTVLGEKRQREERSEDKRHITESFYGKFSRVFNLGGKIDQDKIEASMQDGILTIEVPKAASEVSKKIPIKG